MDYNKLSTFITVVREGSMTRAATQLHRTQSAITQQIQQLESDLGLALLHRKNSRIFLTKEGAAIYEAAQTRLGELDDTIAGVRDDLGSIGGDIRIGIRPDIASAILPPLFREFSNKFPGVRFQVEHGDSAGVERMLTQNEVDFGVMLFVEDRALFEVHPLRWHNVMLTCSREYRKKAPPIRVPRDLLTHPIVDYTNDCDALAHWMWHTNKRLIANVRRKEPRIVCSDSAMAKAMIQSDLGVGMLPLYLIEEELKSGELVHVFPEKARKFRMSFDLALKKKRSLRLIESEFLRYCLERWA